MRAFNYLLALLIGYGFIPLAAANVLLTTINGEEIDFATLKGRWVLINYWASWCQPCLNEIKVFNQFYQTKKNDVALYAVNFDGISTEEQRVLISKLDLQYPSLLNDPREPLGLEAIRGVPATFVFNPQGQLKTTLYGEQTLASLNQVIDSDF